MKKNEALVFVSPNHCEDTTSPTPCVRNYFITTSQSMLHLICGSTSKEKAGDNVFVLFLFLMCAPSNLLSSDVSPFFVTD